MPRITSLRCPRSLPCSGVREAVVLPVAQDHVVEDSNAEQLADLTQALRELDVLARRRRIAAGVIVHQNDRCRRQEDGRTENFAGMRGRGGQRPNRDRVNADQAVLRVEKRHDKLLPINPLEERP